MPENNKLCLNAETEEDKVTDGLQEAIQSIRERGKKAYVDVRKAFDTGEAALKGRHYWPYLAGGCFIHSKKKKH